MALELPEGATPLDPNELKGLRHAHITTRAELDELEQANIEAGLRWVNRKTRVEVFDDTFLRELHRMLFGQIWTWAGKYRLTEKNIGVAPFRVATEIRLLLADAEHWSTNDTYPALETAARFHHRLVAIHPFSNGNGRHARVAADLMLKSAFQHEPIAWAGESNLLIDSERRQAYISALRAADAGDYGPLLTFVGHR